MKICTNHLTGTKRCWCGAKAMPTTGSQPGIYDKREKRAITAEIRAGRWPGVAGQIPVADLRRGVTA